MPAQATIPAVSSQPVNVVFDGNQTAIAALTDSTSGTAGATLATVTLTDNTGGTPGTSVEDVTASPTQALINNNFATVAALLDAANDNIASLAAKVNALSAMLTTLGLTE